MPLIPSGIALVLSTPLAGRLTDQYPPKAVAIAGLLLFGGSFFALYAPGQHIGYTSLIAATVVARIGLGMILPALNLATLRLWRRTGWPSPPSSSPMRASWAGCSASP